MFRKPVSLSGEHALSGADKKKLRRCVQSAFSFGEDVDVLDALLPLKSDVRVAKVASPSRASLYWVDGVPLLVDLSSKGDWLPTLFALWRAPNLLSSLTLRHSDVSAFIVGGADLMLPGVATESLTELREGELRAVFTPGNPCALAVGTLCMSASALAAAGGRGKLLTVLHCFRDCLWELSPTLPNQGFLAEAVRPLEAQEAGAEAAAELQQELATPSATTGDATTELAALSLGPEEMDALLDSCLFQALRTRIKDRDLPLPCGSLLPAHLLPCRPAGSHVDVKRSSYKKLTRFLQAKAAQGLVTLKEDKQGEISIASVNRRHPALLAHARHFDECASGQDLLTEAQEGGLVLEDGAITPLHIEEVLTPSCHTRFILGADGEFSAAEATEALWRYVDAEGLGARASTANRVLLDPALCDALFEGEKRADPAQPLPTELLRCELPALFLGRCAHLCRVRRGGAELLRRTALPAVRLSHETRAKGKAVTVVAALEPYLVDADALAAQLRERCAASCAVHDLPRPANMAARAETPKELVLQGERAAVVAQHLVDVWGVPRRCVTLPAGVKALTKSKA